MRARTRMVLGARRRFPFLLVALASLACAPAASAAVLNPVVGSPFATGASADPFSVAFSPSGALLASANDADGTVSVLSVSASGELTAVGSPSATGVSPVSVSFNASGDLLAVSNYFDSTVSVFSVAAGGALAEVPGSPFPTGANPWSLAFSATGDLLATSNFSDDTVSVFSVSAAGALTPVPGSPFPTGSGPTSVAFSPGGLLAVANFVDSTVSLSTMSAAGVPTAVSGSPFATGAGPFSLAFSSTGGRLATANSTDGTLSMFSTAGDVLTASPGSPFTTGGSPAAVAFRPGGGLIASGDSGNGTLSVFFLSPGGGVTTAPGSPLSIGSTRFSSAFDPSGGLLATPSHDAGTGAGSVAMFSVDVSDGTPPVVNCGSASSDWLAANASIACTASDAQSDLANPSQASLTLTTSVAAGAEDANASTNSVTVCDTAANCSTAGPVAGNKIDRRGPVVSCGSASAQWLAANASIACTASDAGSGLATASQASLTLTTSVAAGAEDANASTNSVEVCDAVGNCSTAGPIAGNKIDRRGPVVSCGSASAQWLAANASIDCTASDAGSGLATASQASLTLTTSVAAGAEDATASTNSVEVCDAAGNCSTAGPIAGNKIDRRAPVVSCGSASAAWLATNVSIACTASDTGSGLATASQASFDLTTSVAAGAENANASTNSVDVCDAAGNCATAGPVTGNKIDRRGPVVNCGSASAQVLGTNASIPCTATDAGSGLGTASQSSFSLTTTVAPGTVDLDASTNSVTVCDVLGNCSTAGPIAGNKIDRRGPVVTCGAASPAWLATNASIACTASAGAGLANPAQASFSLVTNVAAGVEDATASTNSVTVCDTLGACVTAGPIAGNKIDRRAPVVSCGSASLAWLATNVSIACTSTDSGSGLATASQASFSLATNVAAGAESANASTNSVNVCDAAGNCSTAGPIVGNKIDRRGPVVSCGAASAAWRATNASIACTASDSGSGLATPAQSSLNLVTNVAAGAENANASTNSVQVCDAAGNCSTAGPIAGNKIDRRGPVVACGTASTQWLAANASIRCTTSDAGSGLATPAQASLTLVTNVAAGAESANASTGSASVCDVAGNCSTAGPIAGNKIDRKAPTVSITSPRNGASFSSISTTLNPPRASYACADSGSGVAACTGTKANGAALDAGLLALGRHTFTVTARDRAGNTATATSTYTIRLL
jgi:DNA-binding beta-propeller fold protein YncE